LNIRQCSAIWTNAGSGGRFQAQSKLPYKMTTKQIAERLVALCREAKWEAAQTELFCR